MSTTANIKDMSGSECTLDFCHRNLVEDFKTFSFRLSRPEEEIQDHLSNSFRATVLLGATSLVQGFMGSVAAEDLFNICGLSSHAVSERKFILVNPHERSMELRILRRRKPAQSISKGCMYPYRRWVALYNCVLLVL